MGVVRDNESLCFCHRVAAQTSSACHAERFSWWWTHWLLSCAALAGTGKHDFHLRPDVLFWAPCSRFDLCTYNCRSSACCKSSHPLISVWTLVAGVCVVVLQPQQRGQDQWCAEGPEDALTGQRCRFSWVVYSSEYTGLLYFAQLLTISDLGAISMQCSNMVLLFGCRCSRVLAPQAIHKD